MNTVEDPFQMQYRQRKKRKIQKEQNAEMALTSQGVTGIPEQQGVVTTLQRDIRYGQVCDDQVSRSV